MLYFVFLELIRNEPIICSKVAVCR